MNVAVTLAPGQTTAKPEVGDVVKLLVFLDEKVGNQGDGWEIDAPSGTSWLPAGSVTVSVNSVRGQAADGNATKLTVDALVHQPGALTVGPFKLRDQVTKTEIDVPPTAVSNTEIAAGTKPKEEPPWILGPVRFGGWDWVALGILLAILAALAATLGRWAYRRLQAHLSRNLTNTERALGALTNLQKYMRSKKALPQEEWKKFSFELAGVLRRYSDVNFRMNTVDMTDREFLHELGAHPGAAPHVHLLAQILGTITEVRYGKKALDASLIPGLLLDSRKFVENTTTDGQEEKAPEKKAPRKPSPPRNAEATK
jgi:hypothetical protein